MLNLSSLDKWLRRITPATGTGDMSANDTFTATISAIVVAVNPIGDALHQEAIAMSGLMAKTIRFI